MIEALRGVASQKTLVGRNPNRFVLGFLWGNVVQWQRGDVQGKWMFGGSGSDLAERRLPVADADGLKEGFQGGSR